MREIKMLSVQAKILTGQYGGPKEIADVIDISFKATANPLLIQPRRRVILCLDRSGSMIGKPIDMVKKTLTAIVQMIEEQKYPIDLSIITFSDQAKMFRSDDLIQNIGRINADGYTNISDALKLAYQKFGNDNFWLALLTDGVPNRGSHISAAELGNLVHTMPKAYIQGFGYGEYNISVMKSISETYQHIDDIEDIPGIFGAYLGEIMTTVGSNVKISLPEVFRNKPFGISVRSYPQNECRITAGRLCYAILVTGITYRIVILPSGDYQCPENLQQWDGKEITISFIDLNNQQICISKKTEVPIILFSPDEEIRRAYFRSARGRIMESLHCSPDKGTIDRVYQKINLWPELAREDTDEINRIIKMIEENSFSERIISGSAIETIRHVSYTKTSYMSVPQTQVIQTLNTYI